MALSLQAWGLCPIYVLPVQYEVAAIDPSVVDRLPGAINLALEMEFAEPAIIALISPSDQ